MNKEIKIALVEDDENLRFLVAERLQTEGYKVLEAANGDEAEKMIVAEQPDIVLLDWMLPGKQGSEVCANIRQQGFDKLIIAVGVCFAQVIEHTAPLHHEAEQSTSGVIIMLVCGGVTRQAGDTLCK